MKDFNLRPKTVKLLQENIGRNIHNIGFGNDFMNMTLKAQATTKTKTKMYGYVKLKSVFKRKQIK